jgi:apolipoprotein N-acyltransferase
MLRKISLFILSAFLSALPYINGKLWIFAWFGFVPLFFAIRNTSKARAFLLSCLTGVVFWTGTIYWLVHVTLLGTIILVLYLALYFGIFGLIISTIDYRLSTIGPILIPSIWVLLEYVRSHLFTGFPWALLAYSQYKNLPVIQITDITGAWGVSFLVMMVNVMIYKVIGHSSWVIGKKQKTTFSYLFPLSLFFLSLIYGYNRLHPSPITYHPSPTFKVSVIQGNIPQELKWDASAKTYILNKYEQLTREAATKKPDLIVWPEASSPGLFGEDYSVFQEISSLARNIKIPLIIGTVSRDGSEYSNSALLINSSGKIASRYNKLHLVPFGEYIPFKKQLPFLQTIVPIGDITPGKEYTILEIRNPESEIRNKFAVLICFEDLFPELSRKFRKQGAQFLVNITNDAWYKQTSAPYQHLEASVFRAVENRVFLVRAANTGISGFIDPCGKIISLVHDKGGKEIFVDGYKTQEIIIPKRGLSFYNRLGDYFILVCFLFILYGIILKLKIKDPK